MMRLSLDTLSSDLKTDYIRWPLPQLPSYPIRHCPKLRFFAQESMVVEARTRITSGPVLMISRFSEQPESMAITRCFISDGGGNSQFYFRARSRFAPKIQSRADLFRAFTDSW